MHRLLSFAAPLIVAVSFASSAEAHEPGDTVVLIENAELRLPEKTVDTVPRGYVREVEKINGRWLWVRGKQNVPGWLDSRFVLSAEKGMRHFQEAIRKSSKDATAYYAVGTLASRRRDYARAVDSFTQYIRLKPEEASGYVNRGSAWFKTGEYEKALADYDRVIELDPEDAEAYTARGDTWRAKGKYDKAIADYVQAIRLDAKNAEAYFGRGDAHRAMGEYDRAIEDFTKAIQFEKRRGERDIISLAGSYVMRALVWGQKGVHGPVIEDAGQAIKFTERITKKEGGIDARAAAGQSLAIIACFLRASVYLAEKDFDAAIEDATQGLELRRKLTSDQGATQGSRSSAVTEIHALTDSAIGDLYRIRGAALFEKGDFGRAIPDLDRAIEAGVREHEVYAARGFCRFQLKQHKAAIDDLTEALRQDPKYVWALAKRAEVWEALGKQDRAGEDRRKAAALDPKYALAELERIGVGKLRERLQRVFPQGIAEAGETGGKSNRHLAEANAALAKDPDNDQLYVSRGVLWARQGDDDKAIDDFSKVIELNPGNAEAWAERGTARVRLGEFDEGRSDLDRAMELNSELRPRLLAVRGGTWFPRGRFEAGLADLEKAVELEGNLHTAHHDLALQLVTCPDPRFRDAKKAIHHATKACELTDWSYSNYLEMLAAAYAENGDFAKAVNWQVKAMELANVHYNPQTAAERLAEYTTEREEQLKYKQEAVVELYAPVDAKVSVDGRDRGEQRIFTFNDIPHGCSVETTLKVTIPDKDKIPIERRLILRAGWRVVLPFIVNPARSEPSSELHRVHSVAFAPDGKSLLIGVEDAAFLFDSDAESPLRRLPAGKGEVRGVAFSPNGRTALTSTGKESHLVELKTGNILQTIETKAFGPPSVAFGPTGQWFLTSKGRNAAAIWDVGTGATLKELTTGFLMSYAAALDPKGRSVMLDATPYEYAVVWSLRPQGNTPTDAYRELLPALFPNHYLAGGHRNAIRCGAFSPDGSLVLTGDADGKAILWALDFFGEQQKVRDKDVQAPLQLRTFDGHPDALTTVGFTADRQQVLTASEKEVILWDVESGTQVGKFQAALANSHYSAALSPDGRFVAVADAGGVTFFDVATSSCVAGLVIAKDGTGWVLLDAYARSDCPKSVLNEGLAVVDDPDRKARIRQNYTPGLLRHLLSQTEPPKN